MALARNRRVKQHTWVVEQVSETRFSGASSPSLLTLPLPLASTGTPQLETRGSEVRTEVLGRAPESRRTAPVDHAAMPGACRLCGHRGSMAGKNCTILARS